MLVKQGPRLLILGTRKVHLDTVRTTRTPTPRHARISRSTHNSRAREQPTALKAILRCYEASGWM